ncbi:LCP family protein [Gracilibacillus kekensis]|uniref:Transcriptional attenuator, LytR family n=1 Tax=Gracilibacillus kekensis TaxID=1027249 RepID=A0A1M7IWH6_9BACI|nr:LCP family protein [Gracilibacillus kekensis]SHM45092.1 transcriptional attenuator, LytR family [Gracilibacillus kekensis]
MAEKFDKKLSYYIEDEELTFTKEDRDKTIQKIRRQTEMKEDKKSNRRIVPIVATVAAFLLAIALLPSFIANESPNADSMVAQQGDMTFSTLVMARDSSSPPHRNPVNILLTVNRNDKSIKAVSFPRATYVDIYDAEGNKQMKDKLLHTGAYYPDPDASLLTVSKFLQVPIDYYSFVPIEKFSQMSDYIDKKSKKSAVEDILSEQEVFKHLMEQIQTSKETDIPSELLDDLATSHYQMEVIKLKDSLKDTFIEERYYVEIEDKRLESITNQLLEHLNEE